MAAAVHNFTIEQGVTFSKSFIWKDSNEDVIDLTGFSARMQVRQSVNSSTVLLSATTANSKLTITAAEGKVTLSLTDAETSALSFDFGVYDLELVASDDEVTRLVQGSITVSKEVTR